MRIITLTKMTNRKIQHIQDLILSINRKYKNSNKRKKELKFLLSYVSTSDLFKGDKKKIYSLIKQNIK